VGFIFVAILVTLNIMWMIEVSRINADIAGIPAVGRHEPVQGLQQKLDSLIEDEKRLKIEYERAFDLEQIEIYAVNELGMVRPEAEELINIVPQDKAVILAEGVEPGFFESVLSYFK
jgi:hypothetical protein